MEDLSNLIHAVSQKLGVQPAPPFPGLEDLILNETDLQQARTFWRLLKEQYPDLPDHILLKKLRKLMKKYKKRHNIVITKGLRGTNSPLAPQATSNISYFRPGAASSHPGYYPAPSNVSTVIHTPPVQTPYIPPLLTPAPAPAPAPAPLPPPAPEPGPEPEEPPAESMSDAAEEEENEDPLAELRELFQRAEDRRDEQVEEFKQYIDGAIQNIPQPAAYNDAGLQQRIGDIAANLNGLKDDLLGTRANPGAIPVLNASIAHIPQPDLSALKSLEKMENYIHTIERDIVALKRKQPEIDLSPLQNAMQATKADILGAIRALPPPTDLAPLNERLTDAKMSILGAVDKIPAPKLNLAPIATAIAELPRKIGADAMQASINNLSRNVDETKALVNNLPGQFPALKDITTPLMQQLSAGLQNILLAAKNNPPALAPADNRVAQPAALKDRVDTYIARSMDDKLKAWFMDAMANYAAQVQKDNQPQYKIEELKDTTQDLKALTAGNQELEQRLAKIETTLNTTRGASLPEVKAELANIVTAIANGFANNTLFQTNVLNNINNHTLAVGNQLIDATNRMLTGARDHLIQRQALTDNMIQNSNNVLMQKIGNDLDTVNRALGETIKPLGDKYQQIYNNYAEQIAALKNQMRDDLAKAWTTEQARISELGSQVQSQMEQQKNELKMLMGGVEDRMNEMSRVMTRSQLEGTQRPANIPVMASMNESQAASMIPNANASMSGTNSIVVPSANSSVSYIINTNEEMSSAEQMGEQAASTIAQPFEKAASTMPLNPQEETVINDIERDSQVLAQSIRSQLTASANSITPQSPTSKSPSISLVLPPEQQDLKNKIQQATTFYTEATGMAAPKEFIKTVYLLLTKLNGQNDKVAAAYVNGKVREIWRANPNLEQNYYARIQQKQMTGASRVDNTVQKLSNMSRSIHNHV